eukprot:5313369-Prymnesium_polylepis.1
MRFGRLLIVLYLPRSSRSSFFTFASRANECSIARGPRARGRPKSKIFPARPRLCPVGLSGERLARHAPKAKPQTNKGQDQEYICLLISSVGRPGGGVRKYHHPMV